VLIELANYQFQKHFFRPFELIMLHNHSHGTRELIVECMNKMVQSRVHNIKSGWRGVFVVIQTGAAQSFQPLVASSFALLSTCVDKHFDLLTSTTDTMDVSRREQYAAATSSVRTHVELTGVCGLPSCFLVL
jgi:brefeldin A-inhibited guanine nucleotide-exchange protein